MFFDAKGDSKHSAGKNDELNALLELGMRYTMEKKSKIKTFEELGMTNPFRTKETLAETKAYVDQIAFTNDVYPEHMLSTILLAVKDKTSIKPPKVVFIPNRTLLR
jgi:hypothetical protein